MTLDPTQAKADIDALVTQAAADQQAAVDAATAPLLAQIQQLEAELHPTPPPPPATVFGVNASTKAQHDAFAALLSPKVWRYYHQAGEALTYPTEYTLGAGESFILSGKVLPQNLTLTKALAAGHPVMLPQQITTSMLVSLFQSCPTDRKTRFCLWHEPEDDIAAGHFTLADYKAAWVRARQAQRQAGNANVLLMPILMGYTFQAASKRNPTDYLPDDPADWDELGVDPYFGGNIGQPVSAIPTAFDPMVALAQKYGKGWGVCETGIGAKVSGQARIDAFGLLARTLRAKGATVVAYFLGQSLTATEWGQLSSAEAAAWKAAQA